MNYDDFSEEVRHNVEHLVRERLGDGIAVVRNITKNNNVRMRAISIMRKGEKATPTIYIKSYYTDYKKGRSIESICEDIFQIYKKGIDKFKFDFNAQDFFQFEKIKGKIFYKLINYEMNEKILKNLPFFKYLDMAIVFYIMISCDEESQASSLVHNIHLETWGISPKQLKELAFHNTWEKYPPVIKEMEDIISEMIINDLVDCESKDNKRQDTSTKDDSPSDSNFNNDSEFDDNLLSEDTSYLPVENTHSKQGDSEYYNFSYEKVKSIIQEEVEKLKFDREMDMFVLTNNIRTNGAACITYPGVLKKFAEEHQSDVYIIPSSIHEVILIPEFTGGEESLNKMITAVNKNELDPVEILSDHVYIFSRKKGEIVY